MFLFKEKQLIDRQDLAQAAEDEIARRRLLPFAKAVTQFTWPRHIVYWLHLLECVLAGSIRKLLLIGPPGHGKSTTVQLFAAFLLLTQPGRRLLILSAQESLAERNSKAVRELVREQKLWPDVSINAETRAALHWELSNGSECRVFSVNSVVTGHRADAVILDDVQPGPMTLGTRDALESWYRGILESRLEPNAPVVVLNNRWSTDDLVARIE
ncbi:MAG TPA: terminase family protein, partial [Candidatus Acidoferrales bacterium]|nr:terminase family protein [Candidatus Acidoferrales bacterium]